MKCFCQLRLIIMLYSLSLALLLRLSSIKSYAMEKNVVILFCGEIIIMKEKELVENYHQLKALYIANGKQFFFVYKSRCRKEMKNERNAEKAPNNNLFIINLFIYASKISFGFIFIIQMQKQGTVHRKRVLQHQKMFIYYLYIYRIYFVRFLFLYPIYMEKFL